MQFHTIILNPHTGSIATTHHNALAAGVVCTSASQRNGVSRHITDLWLSLIDEAEFAVDGVHYLDINWPVVDEAEFAVGGVSRHELRMWVP